jgi:large subunit ribosomal protein L22
MEIIATQKFVKMSPKKIRPIVYEIKGLLPERIIEVLPFVSKRGAQPIAEVFKTAIANAKQKGFAIGDLKLKEIQILEGPRLKRGRPVSRGRWHPYKKRMSHVRIILETKTILKSEVKNQKSKTTDSADSGMIAQAGRKSGKSAIKGKGGKS